MKINYIVSAALLACVASTAVNAQTTKSAMVDSINKQLERGAKPAKAGSVSALKTNTTAVKSSSSGAAAKTARVVQVPAITTQSATASPKIARAVVSTDSGSNAAPPVARSAKVAKAKPPGE